MIDTFIFVIPGVPIAKKRPRFVRRGKFVGTYNEQETEEGRFLLSVRTQYKASPLEGALKVEMIFLFPRPKGHFGRKGLKPSAPKHHTKKPDLDNCIKFVKDCLNKEVWNDDSSVVYLEGTKKYVEPGMEPATQIKIERVI